MRSSPLPLPLPIVFSLAVLPLPGADSPPPPSPPSEARAILWLANEVPRWSRENRCRSCHNDGDGTSALVAAHAASIEFPEEALKQGLPWLAAPEDWRSTKAGEDDPGGIELARIQFSRALAGAVASGLLDRAPLLRAAEKLAGDQLANGSWKGGSENAVGSPTAYSRHLATETARSVLAVTGRHEDARRRAEAWLVARAPVNVHQASVLLLGTSPREKHPGDERIGESLALIRTGRSPKGDWGPYASSPPEVFDTALVLMGLARVLPRLESGEKNGERAAEVREWIRRGRESLVALQEKDGSWQETTRPAGAESYAQRVSTTAWAALALIETR